MPFAAAVSSHPVPAIATGEATGQVLEELGAHVDVACCFVTSAHTGAVEDVAAAVRTVLSPTLLIGCVSDWVLGNSTEVEGGPGIVVWAGITGPVAPMRLRGDEASLDSPFPLTGLLVVADPSTFPVEPWLDMVAHRHPGLPVAGGLVHGGPLSTMPGARPRTRLLVDDRVVDDGAVGVLVGPGTVFDAVVSQGCRTIGQPLVVTRAERNVIYELAGRPAVRRLLEIAQDQIPAEQVRLINEGLQLGVVIDESQVELAPGDFLMRPVLGADPSNGAIAVGAAVEVGTTVQFSVRDAASADQDLHDVLADRSADGALLFSCTGRGTRMFDEANHDVEVVGAELGFPPLAGIFAAGEIGPAGIRSHVHSQSASLALFADR